MLSRRVVYSLPFKCPIPFPATPSYPIQQPATTETDLAAAYQTALCAAQANPSALDSFARLLVHLVAAAPADSLAPKLRALVLPVHDFNIKYLSLVPDALAHLDPSDHSVPLPPIPGLDVQLADDEREQLVAAYAAWARDRQKEREPAERAPPTDDRPHATRTPAADAMLVEGATEQGPAELDKPASWTIDDESLAVWISDLELSENLLQCLLALALLTLPPPTIPPPRPRKKADPQRHAATLDPETQLDFLTDQLVLWRVDKVVLLLAKNNLDSHANGTTVGATVGVDDPAAGGPLVAERDRVHEWWEDTVEPLFSPRLSSAVLAPHRAKLFPAASTTESLSSRLVPAPSPFRVKDRTLLSLDKSARRRDHDSRPVSDSPTMKRLLGWPLALEQGDVFKMPPSRPHRTTSKVAGGQLDKGDELAQARARKQERPRPRAVTASAAASKNMFSRREVNLARRPGAAVSKKPPPPPPPSEPELPAKSQSQPALVGRGTKRKSVSPRKTRPSETVTSRGTSQTLFIPDTPLKPREPFSRTQSLPSFAALGAAFRPGSTDPFQVGARLPPSAELVGDEDYDGRAGWVVPDT